MSQGKQGKQGNAVPSMPSHDEVERAIRSVPGVAEASVARAEDTGRGRLHIRLRPGEDLDRVSWSVAATLRERFDIVLDPAAIRPRSGPGVGDETTGDAGGEAGPAAATTPRDPRPEADGEGDATANPVIVLDTAAPVTIGAPDRARPWRPVIRDLGSHSDGMALTVTATLELDGRRAAGEATGTPTARGLHRTIAEATLLALGQLTATPLRAQVDRVTVGDVDPAAATVVVSFLSDRGDELLVGTSIVRGDVEHAVMRAALDALNRRVQLDLATKA